MRCIADKSSCIPDLVKNTDGSVDLYIGSVPQPVAITTGYQPFPGTRGSLTFRLYGPFETYLDQSWPLPDIEEIT